MILGLMSIMLAVTAQNPPATAPQEPGVSFVSKKGLTDLQTCLTEKLSEIGEVVAVAPEQDSMTLLVRDNPDGPMVIDLTPQKVTVTSKFITGSQKLIKDCL